jgi:hypothetical protein
LNSNWVLIDLKNRENLLNESTKKLKRVFKSYRDKHIFLIASEPEIGYLFTLKLRKLNFKAYNIKTI